MVMASTVGQGLRADFAHKRVTLKSRCTPLRILKLKITLDPGVENYAGP